MTLLEVKGEASTQLNGTMVIQQKRGLVLMGRVFNVIVERDPESGFLVGEVVELPGCYTQAPNLPALESNIREAIQAYLFVHSCARS
jgi:hypothetical protein